MPASTTWKYVENQFEAETVGSYKKMNALVVDADAKLAGKTDPDLLALYNRLHPAMVTYTEGYSVWTAAQGLYKGATKSLNAQLKLLSSTKARQWDTAVLAVYDDGTPEHTAIFPNGRGKLQTGTIDNIIKEVNALADRLLPYVGTAALATLRTAVQAFYTLISGLRSTQQGKEGEIPTLSSTLEALRASTAIILYGNLGALMRKYEATPMSITGYFDLQLLRQPSKDKPADIQAIVPAV